MPITGPIPTPIDKLFEDVTIADGGLARWKALTTVQATIVTGGAFWGMKSLVQDPMPRAMKVWLHDERSSVQPFGAPDQRTAFTPERIAIERTDGTIVAERLHPRDSFQQTTPRDPLHRACFNGYALWTYLTTPFLLTMPGVEVHEVEPFAEGRGGLAKAPGALSCESRDSQRASGLFLR